jgi:hypothetical protein
MAIWVFTLVCGFATRAQAPLANPFVGMWKLSLERSRLSDSPPPNYVRFRGYQDRGGGWMYHTIVDSIGNAADFTFAAVRYDGKEYPVYTSLTLGRFLSLGAKSPRTVAFRTTDPRTLDYIDRVIGKITATGTSTVSKDGKTITETDRTFDSGGREKSKSIVVYEKQLLGQP